MRTAFNIVSALGLALCAALAQSGVVAASAADAAAPAPAFQVIVHPSNTVTAVRRGFLADAYLKKVTRWPDDRVIRPADLHATSAARAGFSTEVLRRSIDAVKAYWQRRVFAGQAVPPPEFARDAEVVSYVLQHPSAVGYISSAADLQGARVVPVTH
jgi:ABC-type phosphate transport system substrate-binding protein